jgi:hypothetical protein
MKIFLAIVVIVGIIVGLILAWRCKNSWRKAFKDLARFANLMQRPDFIPTSDLEKLEIFTRRGWKYGASNVIAGQWQSWPVMALKYDYVIRDTNGSTKSTYYVIHTRLLNVSVPEFMLQRVQRGMPEFMLQKVQKGTLSTDGRMMTNHAEMDRLYVIMIDSEEEMKRLRRLFSQPVINALISRRLKKNSFIQASENQVAIIFLNEYIKPGELNGVFSNFMEFVKALDVPGQV